jgi:predicted dehydrogenase
VPASKRTIRYAIVGLGHIAQVAVLPAFAHARRNSRLTAIVSGDRTKRRELAKRYRLEQVFAYDQFDECLRKGHLQADPAYDYAEGLEYRLTLDGRTTRKTTPKRDQFAPELLYFSDCILNDREPEPSGEEGLQDVRIVEALYQSAKTGYPITIRPFTKTVRPTGRQRIIRPGVKKPALVKVQSASQD